MAVGFIVPELIKSSGLRKTSATGGIWYMSFKVGDSSISSLLQRNLSLSTKAAGQNFKALSSGNRLTSSSVDAAAMQIAESLAADIKSAGVAARNISDGISLARIAEGGLTSAGDITARLGELAAQAANDTLSSSQRSALDQEFQQLTQELDRISNTTVFNGKPVLGSTTSIQSGTDGSSSSQTGINLPNVSASGLGVGGQSLQTKAGAEQGMKGPKQPTATLASGKAEVGASTSRLTVAFENIQSQRLANESARSQLVDADYAKESSNLIANNIKQQTGASLMAMTNKDLSQNILRLLRI